MPLFTSPRLSFREITPADAPYVLALNSNAEVLRYIHEHPTDTLEKALTRINESIIPHYKHYGYGRWAVMEKETGAFIGWCGLKFRPELNEIDLGYRFIRSAWNKGYATEASRVTLHYGFYTLQLPRIIAVAQTGNTASIRVMEKCGMQFSRMDVVDGFEVKVYEQTVPSC